MHAILGFLVFVGHCALLWLVVASFWPAKQERMEFVDADRTWVIEEIDPETVEAVAWNGPAEIFWDGEQDRVVARGVSVFVPDRNRGVVRITGGKTWIDHCDFSKLDRRDCHLDDRQFWHAIERIRETKGSWYYGDNTP